MYFIQCPNCNGNFVQRSWYSWDPEDNPNPHCMTCGYIITTDTDKRKYYQSVIRCHETISNSTVKDLDKSISGMARVMQYIDNVFALTKNYQGVLETFMKRHQLVRNNPKQTSNVFWVVETEMFLGMLFAMANGIPPDSNSPVLYIQNPPQGCGIIDKYLMTIAYRSKALMDSYSKFLDKNDHQALVQSGNLIEEIADCQKKMFNEITKIIAQVKSFKNNS